MVKEYSFRKVKRVAIMKYQITKGSKSFGTTTIFQNIVFEIKNNEKIAIVGRNGSGKTTLLKIIAGMEDLDAGNIYKEKNLTIGYLAQITFSDGNKTLEAELETIFESIQKIENELQQLELRMKNDQSDTLLNKYATLQETFQRMNGYNYRFEMETILYQFGFQKEDLKRTVNTFSGGQKTRLAFVKLLLEKPDVLMLDEPTNHLDLRTIEWLEGYLKYYPKAVIMVSHDRMFLDRVSEVIYEIEFDHLTKYVGNYTNFQIMKEKNIDLMNEAYHRQQKEIKRLEEQIEKFRYKSSKASFAQSKIKYLERMDKVDEPKSDNKTFHAHFTSRIRGGNQVLQMDHLIIGYHNKPLCEVNLELKKGQRVAIIGDNGQGKSTLLKTLVNKIPALEGTYLYGHQIEIGYFDQELAQFESTNTVIEEIWNAFPNMNQTEVRNALGCFLFYGDDVFKTIDTLSGGEKVRLTFVKLMLSKPNLLILDEPTNHLDILGKEALEKALKDYDGTMLFVSHDRFFISKLSTSILKIENHHATYYPYTLDELYEKEEKKETKLDKKIKKEKLKNINYGKEISKIETKIQKEEDQLEALKILQFDPEYYQDYQKMADLDEQIAMVLDNIDVLMKTWEEYQAYLMD